MKILRIEAIGLPLFKEKLDITFYAQQRVSEENKSILYSVSETPPLYLNTANAFIGINASGKTSILKAFELAASLLRGESLNHIASRNLIGGSEHAIFRTCFFSNDNHIFCLETAITSRLSRLGEYIYTIADEKIWKKNLNSVKSKKYLTDFSDMQPVAIRQKDERYLPDDVSFIIGHNKETGDSLDLLSLMTYTNMNILPFSEDIPLEAVRYLDSTIENLYFEKDGEKLLIHLKFWNTEEIIINNAAKLEQYLSSGTIKGIMTFSMLKDVLCSGGYLLIDEIENHFNKEIVMTILRFFLDSSLNKKGGILVFTTHYPEILDEYERNDSIYIVRNRNGITAKNLSQILHRNDIRKSDAYQSGFLEGTTPQYEAYIKLKESVSKGGY